MNKNKELRELHQVDELQSILLLFRTFFFVVLSILICEYFNNLFIYIIGVFFIGARQCSLYEINHEISHRKFFKNKKINDFAGLLFCTLPFFHHPEAYSSVMWRRVHRLHHRNLMTSKDPNYLERVNNKENLEEMKGLNLIKKLVLVIPKTVFFFVKGKQDYVFPGNNENDFKKSYVSHLKLLFFKIQNDDEMEKERKAKLRGFVVLGLLIILLDLTPLVFTYWIVPMIFVYPVLLKYMDFYDHRWWLNPLEADEKELSRTQTFGLFKKIFVSDVGRCYHLEHHLFPMVPWNNMANLARLESRTE